MSNEETKKQMPNAVDLILDGWVNSFKALHTFQTELAEKSLQTFATTQKDVLTSTREALSKIEEEKNSISGELNANLQNTIQTINNDQVSQLLSSWMSQVEEINHSVQAISASSSQVLLDLFTQTQVQLETNVKATLDQQQKNSSDVLNKIELLTEHIKETNRILLPTV
ncbi:hypothetical protein MHB48_17510 [Psychrobacillus sp. FSL H8-0483]|uniref:hypothetical protein n=1 Tax=Psychrobacillus sp. FSL H8-0483 TaxID=2921389 RepID=UPI00315AE8C7